MKTLFSRMIEESGWSSTSPRGKVSLKEKLKREKQALEEMRQGKFISPEASRQRLPRQEKLVMELEKQLQKEQKK